MPSSTFEIDSQQRALRLARLVQQIRANLAGRALRPFADMPAPENLSKRKLSRLLGVSPTLINKYESGEIDPWEIRWGLMRRLARLADLSLEQLDAHLNGNEGEIQSVPVSRPVAPYELITLIRSSLDRLEGSLYESVSSESHDDLLIPWFGRYLRTLLADQARESRRTLSDLTDALIAAFPSNDPDRAALLKKVLEGQAELTNRQIEEECVGLATALSEVIEVPVTAGQLLSLLPDAEQRSQISSAPVATQEG